MKLHHIGIVVPGIKDSIGDLTNYIKFETISIPMSVVSQKVNICFLKVGEPLLELIEPVEKNSPVYDFAKKGGGIHHICFEVDDIHAQLDDMEKKGATVIVKPVTGFDNRLIAFLDLNMKNTKCGLVELLESKN
ncbi:MAG TPA: VOC family protein [Nitrosopumilaceae archaeon]|nr:VOC family protein [Nitrosopumilaceae archaeon]